MDAEDRELRPAGRYEWEQIVRRARLGGVIAGSGRVGKNGRPTKGGMSGAAFTGIALAWATYANDRGREIWAGDATVAIDMETTIKAVRQVRQALVRLGLMEFVAARRRDRGDEYRLTLPSDLLESVVVLTPAQHKLAAQRLRDAARGKRGGSDGLPADESVGGPVDHPEETPDADSGSPVDHPHEEPCGSNGPPENGSGWSDGPAPGGPTDPHTDHYRTTTTTDQPEIDVRTAVTVPRASDAAKDQDLAEKVGDAPAPSAAHCPKHGRGFSAGTRPDGKPACPFCRVGAPATSPRGGTPEADPEADHARELINEGWAAAGIPQRVADPAVVERERPDNVIRGPWVVAS